MAAAKKANGESQNTFLTFELQDRRRNDVHSRGRMIHKEDIINNWVEKNFFSLFATIVS
jgi:hypothetical protein